MYNWIDVNIQKPELRQDVAFIIKSDNPIYNKRRLGGRYLGFNFGYHEFSVPGASWQGTHWLPLPELPPCTCGFTHDEKYN
jgi:hypothetical protein